MVFPGVINKISNSKIDNHHVFPIPEQRILNESMQQQGVN